MRDTSATTKMIAETTTALLKKHGFTQVKTAAAIGRSQSYVQTRWNGLQAWDTDDLDAIAKKCLGLPNGFALIDVVRGVT